MGNCSPGRAIAARTDGVFRLVAWLAPNWRSRAGLSGTRALTVTASVAPSAVYVSRVKAGIGASKETKMTKLTRSLFIAAATLAAVSTFAPAAWAGCGVNMTALKKHASWTASENGMLIPVNLGQASIVGMWSVVLNANGGQFDWGYQVWHDDGTEIMNSGSRAPATENFCMGVWAQSGPQSYKLNHFALSYDQTTGALNARVNIKENVTVDAKGTSFSGPFTADILPVGGSLIHISGQIVGQRVTVN